MKKGIKDKSGLISLSEVEPRGEKLKVGIQSAPINK